MKSAILHVWLVLAILLFLPAVALAAEGSEATFVGFVVALVPALLALLIAILREIAPRSPNKYDDMALEALSSIKPEDIDHLKRLLDPEDYTGVATPVNPTGVAPFDKNTAKDGA